MTLISLAMAVLAAVAIVLWAAGRKADGARPGWRRPALRKPLLLALIAGAFGWSMMPGMFRFADGPNLSKLAAAPLTILAGTPTNLVALAGRPADGRQPVGDMVPAVSP